MKERYLFKTYKSFVIILLTLLVSGTASIFANPSIQVNYNQKTSRLPIRTQDGLEFVAFQDLAECLDARTYYSDKTKKAILYLGSQEIKVTALNPYVIIDDKIFQMPIETCFLNADIFIPIKYFLQLLAHIPDLQIFFNEIERKIDIQFKDSAGAITELTIEPKSNGILIKIPANKPFSNNDVTTRVSKNWVYLDIYKGVIDSLRLGQIQPSGIIQDIVPLQISPNLAQISFKVTQPIIDVKASIARETNNIVLSIRTKDSLSENIIKALETDRQKWLIDKIAIDPGHGGKDPGAIGQGGVYEKKVVLKIAHYLRELISKNTDIDVFMTREGDQFVPLNQRTAMANQVGAKLFISIHANSNRSTRIKGASTYILGPAKTEEAIEVARIENSVIRLEASKSAYPNFDDEQFILSSIAQSEFTRESEELAAIVQIMVTQKTNLRDRGIKQAGYYVLIGASMPNILFEVAFISNPQEEKLLNSNKFQKKVAEALFESIIKFKEKYEQTNTVFQAP